MYQLFLFIVLTILLFGLTLGVLKPWLQQRLRDKPTDALYTWLTPSADGDALVVNDQLYSFVVSNYDVPADSSCDRYLHVFAHTNVGLPLAILFERGTRRVLETRFLRDTFLDPHDLRYKRGHSQCITSIDSWRRYFSSDQKQQRYAGTSAMSLLTVQQPPVTLSKLNYTVELDKEQRVPTLRIGDYSFQLTDLRWRGKTSQPDNTALSIIDKLPSEQLIRVEDNVDTLSGDDDIIVSERKNKADPCWDETVQRPIIGRREVTVESFYRGYLRGLQLPPRSDSAALERIKQRLRGLYFECVYDTTGNDAEDVPATTDRAQIELNETQQSALYPIVTKLRTCAKNTVFNAKTAKCE